MILFDKCTHTLGMKAPPNSGFTQMIIYSYMTVRSGKYSVMHVFLNIYYMKEIQLVMRKQTCNHLCPTSAILPCTASQGGSQPAWDPQILKHRWLEGNISGKNTCNSCDWCTSACRYHLLFSFVSLIHVPVVVTKWVFPKIGVGPQNGWFVMEEPIKMDDLGGKPHIFWKHPNLAQLPPTKKRKPFEAHPSQASNRVVPPCGSPWIAGKIWQNFLRWLSEETWSNVEVRGFFGIQHETVFLCNPGEKIHPVSSRDLLVFVSVEKIIEEIQTTWLREMSQFSHCRGSVLESKNLSLFVQACFPSFSDLKTSSSSPTRPNI